MGQWQASALGDTPNFLGLLWCIAGDQLLKYSGPLLQFPVAEADADLSAEVVIVEIVDNGTGIPEDAMERIFEPFFTTKPPGAGTGLGLDISYNIVVNKHHGDIKVESEPGRTSFQVWLPVNFQES